MIAKVMQAFAEKVRDVAMFLGHVELNLFSTDLNDLRLWTAMS